MTARTDRRNAIKTLLADGNTSCGDRWYVNPGKAVWKKEKPVGLIFILDDDSAEDNEDYPDSEGPQRKRLTITIEIAVDEESLPGNDVDVDAALDTYEKEVEDLIRADPTVGKLFESISPPSSSKAFDDDGDGAFGGIQIRYRAVYYDNLPVPEVGPVPDTVLTNWTDDGSAYQELEPVCECEAP